MSHNLEQWWQSTWSDLRLPAPAPDLFVRLLAGYDEPHRAYHTVQHLEECGSQFARARAFAQDPGAVQLALWFHDAIYDTRSSHNEEQSAAWADQVLAEAGAPERLRTSVQRMILSTKHDAARLGRTPRSRWTSIYLFWVRSQVALISMKCKFAKRYAWVPEETFRGARARILREFLARPCIYTTDHFHNSLEAKARSNLQASLARLGA